MRIVLDLRKLPEGPKSWLWGWAETARDFCRLWKAIDDWFRDYEAGRVSGPFIFEYRAQEVGEVLAHVDELLMILAIDLAHRRLYGDEPGHGGTTETLHALKVVALLKSQLTLPAYVRELAATN